MANFAGVAFNLGIDQVFTYQVPAELDTQVIPGVRVRVPFRKQIKTGFVVELHDSSDLSYTKRIFSVIDQKPLISANLIKLATWLSENYLAPVGRAINLMLPPGIRQKSARRLPAYVELAAGQDYKNLLESLSGPSRRVIEFLVATRARILLKELITRTKASPSTIENLQEKGLIIVRKERDAPDVFQETMPYVPPSDLKPTLHQQTALEEINKLLDLSRGVILLKGVTGSGKTEVYIRSIQHAIAGGKKAIVLVPEISLTPQTVSRFRAYFARTAVLHSYMSSRDRADEWERAQSGEVDVVVGTRSAVFAPVPSLGIIVIDEEHETSYKEHQDPKYHSREVAIKRAELENAVVVLGSATPSIESYHNALAGKFKLVSLPERVQKIRMPTIEIVDMKTEKAAHKKYPVLSGVLRIGTGEALERNEQVILFLNRRGFTTFITCYKCHMILKCRRCDVVLSYHKSSGKYMCHYCMEEKEGIGKCPRCFSDMKQFGMGTERVEDEIKRLFPDRKISRMDSDSMRTRSDYKEALSSLASGKTDILVGTQMIAKGLDVPGVTLVGVISADTAFSVPDFRSAEKTFQLVTQVAGRAGRGPKGGKVIVQTNNPTHYSIICAATYNYEGFAQKELDMRRELHYPPFALLIRIILTSKEEADLRSKSEAFATVLRTYLEESEAVLLGPAVCPIYRIKNLYRMHILLKALSAHTVLRKLKFIIEEHKPNGVRLETDVDPVNVL